MNEEILKELQALRAEVQSLRKLVEAKVEPKALVDAVMNAEMPKVTFTNPRPKKPWEVIEVFPCSGIAGV